MLGIIIMVSAIAMNIYFIYSNMPPCSLSQVFWLSIGMACYIIADKEISVDDKLPLVENVGGLGPPQDTNNCRPNVIKKPSLKNHFIDFKK